MSENRVCLSSPSLLFTQQHYLDKRNGVWGTLKVFCPAWAHLRFQHFYLFIYFRLYSLYFRTFTKKDGNTIKGIEMSTRVLRGFFFFGGGVLRWGGKKGLLGGSRENLLVLQHHGQFRWGSLLSCSPRGPKLANRLCVCRDVHHSVRTARWMDMCPEIILV